MKTALVICTYQRPEPLLTLLNSVKTQVRYPDQILIIDGSIDLRTQAAVEKLSYPNLQYFLVPKETRGLTRQRNFGISKVASEMDIIAFLDDDTILETDYFEKLEQAFLRNPNAAGIGGVAINENRWKENKNNSHKSGIKYYCLDGHYINQSSRDKIRTLLGLHSKELPGVMPSFSHGKSCSYPLTGKDYPVDLIIGMSMSFRKSIFNHIQFSCYFEGYGLYEDADFSIRALEFGQNYISTTVKLKHFHNAEGRPNKFRFGKMVVRNGWYVWRVKNPNPDFASKCKWHAITFLLMLIRGANILTTKKRMEALTEFVGRFAGWMSLLWNKPIPEISKVTTSKIKSFLIISHVIHGQEGDNYYAYAPYVKEMNLWLKHVQNAIIVAPLELKEKNIIQLNYSGAPIDFHHVKSFNVTNVLNCSKSFLALPLIIWTTFKAMRKADHIHIRCPGNMGLIACFIQILFPSKTKTAKYAGNWDWSSKQPFSYRLQQYLLTNTFLTRNMQVLVYGNWPNATKNIKPFFTASYGKNEIIPFQPKELDKGKAIKLIYVGGLLEGKNPIISLMVALKLKSSGFLPEIHFYGEGPEREVLESLIIKYGMQTYAFLHGNGNKKTLKKAYQESHFLIFMSGSEGWPKVVAEAMFWGCVPITTRVSCVPEMLDHGKNGELVDKNEESAYNAILNYIEGRKSYQQTANNAMQWSTKYTLELFEDEIGKLFN